MDIIKEILRTVSDYPGGYRLIYNLIYERNKESGLSYKEQSIRNTLSRMKTKGLISNNEKVWEITPEGKELLKESKSAVLRFTKNIQSRINLPKTTIVIFDIPEKKRLYRDWLRNELIGFGYELIQKSVWYGPALPKEFVSYLGEQKLLEYVRFFKVKEEDLI
jgi:CRISPR-associated endonuclease Cas2